MAGSSPASRRGPSARGRGTPVDQGRGPGGDPRRPAAAGRPLTRVIAGEARGRRLRVPPTGTRPTSDRAREGLFSALQATLGSLHGRRLLDLYAGSGAVAVEALSRGAEHVLLVEKDTAAADVATRNLSDSRLSGGQVLRRAVERVVAEPAAGTPYDVVFADPPYDLPGEELRAVLADVLAHGWLAPDGLVVVERASRDRAWEWPLGLVADRERRYGEGTLWYGRAAEQAS